MTLKKSTRSSIKRKEVTKKIKNKNMANETIRQHYVPRIYMKRFSSERKGSFYIKGIDKDKIEQEDIIEFNTMSVCLRKNLYTLAGETEAERQKIEKFYSEEIETNYDTVYSILTNPAQIFITPKERELIITTIVTMLYRTTKWINEHNKVWNTVLESVYDLCKQTGDNFFRFEGEKISIEGKSITKIQDEFATNSREKQVEAQLEIAFRLIDIRLNDGIFVTKLGKNDCQYITSDNPVILENIASGIIMPFDKNNIISLPIDEKHKLMIMPTRQPSEKNLIVRHTTIGKWADSDMMVSNELQMKNAEKFILGTGEGIENYISTHKKSKISVAKTEHSEIKTLDDLLDKIKNIEKNKNL